MVDLKAELSLIDQVELRLTLPETQEKFEKALGVFLCPLLLKFYLNESQIHVKLYKFLNHISTRYQSYPGLRLPLSKLLDQLESPTITKKYDNPELHEKGLISVASNTLIFVNKAIDRLNAQESKDYLDRLIQLISTIPNVAQLRYKLYNIVIKVLLKIDNLSDVKTSLTPEQFQGFIEISHRFLLLPSLPTTETTIIPGISAESALLFSKFNLDSTFTQNKIKLVDYFNFINIPNNLKVLPFLLASCASRDDKLVGNAETYLHRLQLPTNPDQYVLQVIADLLVGTNTPPLSDTSKHKLLSFICKLSDISVVNISQFTSIALQGLQSDYDKLKDLSTRFIDKYINNANTSDESIQSYRKISDLLIGNISTGALSEFQLSAQSISSSIRSLTTILTHYPQIFSDISVLFKLVDIYKLYSDKEIKQYLRDSINTLVRSFKIADQENVAQFCISNLNQQADKDLSFILVNLLNRSLPFHDPRARVYTLITASEINQDFSQFSSFLNPYYFKLEISDEDVKFPKFDDFISFVAGVSIPEPALFHVISFAYNCLTVPYLKVELNENWESVLSSRQEDLAYILQEVAKHQPKNLASFSTLLCQTVNLNSTSITQKIRLFKMLLVTAPDSGTIALDTTSLLDPSFHMYNYELVDLVLLVTKPTSTGDTILNYYLDVLNSVREGDEKLFDELVKSVLSTLDSLSKNSSNNEVNFHLHFLYLTLQRLSLFGIVSNEYLKMIFAQLIEDSVSLKLTLNASSNGDYFTTLCYVVSDKESFEYIVGLIGKMASNSLKKNDQLFIIGDALSIALNRRTALKSLPLQSQLSFYETYFQKDLGVSFEPITESSEIILKDFIDTLTLPFEDAHKDASFIISQSKLKAHTIWLFCLLGDILLTNSTKSLLVTVHLVFVRMLFNYYKGSSNVDYELIQECSLKGLFLLYTVSPFQKSLLEELQIAYNQNVNSNSRSVFQQVNQSNSTVSSKTFKELIRLSLELNGIKYVINFLNVLVGDAVIWSPIESYYHEQSQLPENSMSLSEETNIKLISRLYPLQFFPDSNVNTIIKKIWSSLYSTSDILEHSQNILETVIAGFKNKDWKIRSCSVLSLTELLNILKFRTYEQQLDQIIGVSFRSLDDVKDSIRTESEKLNRKLVTVVINNVSSTNSEDILNLIIPFLLSNKGLLSDSKDIQAFSLTTLLKLCSNDRITKHILKFIPELVTTLIQLISSLEPEMVNYLYLNASNYNVTTEQLDTQRLSMLNNSPVQDTIEKLIDLIDPYDEHLVDQFFQDFNKSIRRAVGLPSKVLGSKVLVYILLKKPAAVSAKNGDLLLKTVINQISDRNQAVATAYAIAIGHVVRFASFKVVKNFASSTLLSWYFESNINEDFSVFRRRLLSSLVIDSVFKNSINIANSLRSLLLPLTLIGKHDINSEVAESFEHVWLDNANGVTSIKHYLKEICEMCLQRMSSQSHSVRRICAISVADACTKIDDTPADFDSALLAQIFEVLITPSQGRTWDGKEVVIESLVSTAIKFKQMLQGPGFKSTILNVNMVLLKELQRSKKTKKYAIFLLKSVSRYISLYSSIEEVEGQSLTQQFLNTFEEVYKNSYLSIDDDKDLDEDGDIDMEPEGVKSQLFKKEESKVELLQSLADSFTIVNSQTYDHKQLDLLLNYTLEVLESNNSTGSTWRSQNCASMVLKKVLQVFNQSLQKDNGLLFSAELLSSLSNVWDRLWVVVSDGSTVGNVQVMLVRTSHEFLKFLRRVKEFDGSIIGLVVKYQVLVTERLLGLSKSKNTSTILQNEIQTALE
ncbi:hypothetical protein LJB42_003480 [Komagataella kurtzmanii]|nr:hypothetical protein LJB42_003480 [Komagataella kurtzmanii]